MRSYLGHRDREAGPPRTVELDKSDHVTLPWVCQSTIVGGDGREVDFKSSWRSLQWRIPRSSATRHPRGDCRGPEEGFTDGFHHHVEEFIPSRPLTVIPTAGGVASAAAAEPRIEPAP